ncbi:MAG: FecR domain-containing protein [Planctomycetota bacterium]
MHQPAPGVEALNQQDPDNLIQRFLADEVSPELVEQLEAWLREDAAHARVLAEYGLLEQMMVGQQVEDDASSVLALLLEMEQRAEPIDLNNTNQEGQAADWHEEKPALSAQDLATAGSYVLRHSLTPKAIAALATAAMVLLGVVLAAVLLGGPGDDQPVVEGPAWPGETPDTPRSVDEASHHKPIVAALTAEHDAQWRASSGAVLPGVGDGLRAGQRLSLIEGFAEITTNLGAVAILEAPCTFELLDHPNAIRVDTGRLVGIVEAESARGFLVRTPHMDVTDLGTRFGIDATLSSETQVHVFEGEVEAVKPDAAADTQPTRLAAGESARAVADSGVIASIDHDSERFAAVVRTKIQLPGTGQGLGEGQPDQNWHVVAIDGAVLDRHYPVSVSGDAHYSLHIPEDPTTSQFITWLPNTEPPVGGSITYSFRTTISVPNSADPATAHLVIRFMADNELVAVRVNGHRLEAHGGAFLEAFDRWDELVVGEHLERGENTIEFDIRNHRPDEQSASNVGLRVQWELISQTSVFEQHNQAP